LPLRDEEATIASVRPLIQALRQQGAPPPELELVSEFKGEVRDFWRTCSQPLLMMRIAGVAGVDPKLSVGLACRATAAVVDYVGTNEPRPRYALDAARSWLAGKLDAEPCARAGQLAEEVAQAYRAERQRAPKPERRKYRAASYAAFAAARTAFAARDAAVTMELDYDDQYTFEDAWNGAKVGCALAAGQVLIDAVEAACSATAVTVTLETGSSMAGGAAANETRPMALAWACRLVREELEEVVVLAGLSHLLG
jgi:hypothetical protein